MVSKSMSRSAAGSDYNSTETFDLGRKLRLRLLESNQQRERTQTKINSLTDQLQRMFSRAPKKPRDTQEQMDNKIQKLEYRRTTSSLSLSEEKKLLRQIDIIRKEKKVLEEYHVHEQAIQEKKNEISLLRDSLRTISAAIAELESALSKVELAKRLGCTTAELETRVVDCPSDKIGHIIGKNGSALKQLENRTGVQIDVDKVGSKIHLQGSASALKAAVKEVEQITLAVEEEIKLSSSVVSYFLAQRSAVLNKIQATHPLVHLDLSRNNTCLTLRGKPEYIATAKEDIESLEINTVVRSLPSREIGLVVGKGGGTVNKLVADHDVSINVVNENGGANAVVEITGPSINVETALAEIEDLLYQNEEIEKFVMVNPMQRNMFLGNSGAVLKEIQAEISGSKSGLGTLLVFEKRDKSIDKSSSLMKEPSKLIIRTCRSNMDKALTVIQTRITEHEATVVSVTVDTGMVPAIIGKGGATINSLRQEGSGAEIEIDKSTGIIRIQATDENVKKSIINSINKIVAENQVLYVKVERSMIGLIFGESGKEIKKSIVENLGVWMGVDQSDEHIILRGTVEKINEAEGIFKNFIEENYLEEFEILPEDDGVLFHSGESNIMSKLENEHLVSCVYRKSLQKVLIRGRKENVSSAMLELKRFMYGGEGFSVCKVKIPESALGIVIGKGGSHIAKLEKDYPGVTVDLLRISNHLSIRGPEESVKKCRSQVISLVSTAKVFVTVSINSSQHKILSKPDAMKKINDGLAVQITPLENSVKIRGLNNDVKDAKSRLMEQITGIFSSAIEVETYQYAKFIKAVQQQSQLDRIQELTKATISLENNSSSVLISGKRSAVKKAKNQVYGLLEFLMPSEFARVKLSKPLMKYMSNAEFLANVTAETGSTTMLDRELCCIVSRSENPEEVKQAVELVNKRIAEYEKLHYVVRFAPSDSWLLPKIIGKGGSTINSLQFESKCSIDVYKEEITVLVTGETPELVANARELLDKVIEQARKECIFMEIPESAMPAFIGKNGSNINHIASICDVDIERLRKDASRVRIQGQESSVHEAKLTVSKWINEWKYKNIGESVTFQKNLIPLLFGTYNTMMNNISQDTGCDYNICRKTNSVTVRGDEEQVHEFMKHLDKIIIKAETALEKEKKEKMPLEEAKKTEKSKELDEVKNDILIKTEDEHDIPNNHIKHNVPTSSTTHVVYGSGECNLDEEQIRSTIEERRYPENGCTKQLISSTPAGPPNPPRSSETGKDLFQMLTDPSVTQRRLIPKSTLRQVKSTDEPSTGTESVPGTEFSEEANSSVESQQKHYKSASGFIVRV